MLGKRKRKVLSPHTANPKWRTSLRQIFASLLIYAIMFMTIVPTRILANVKRSSSSPAVEKQASPTSESSAAESSRETVEKAASRDDLAASRSGQTATELNDGNVLIVGGDESGTAEIYFAGAGQFGATGTLETPRRHHAAVRLSDGRVLITGGETKGETLASAEIFDPASGRFSPAGQMNTARAHHTMTLLQDGRVLIAGSGTAEIYSAEKNTFTPAGTMIAARSAHSAILLKDGRVLIVGGETNGEVLASGEIFDASTNEFRPAGEMANARKDALLRVLHDGKVQIIGGADEPSIEVFDPNGDAFGARVRIPTDGSEFPELFDDIMSSPTRAAVIGKTTVELSQMKKALAYGDADGLKNGQIFNSSKATVSTEALNYPKGNSIVVTGKGFMSSESVELIFYQTSNSRNNNQPRFSVQADENGEFRFNGFAPQDSDGRILIDAKGSTSGEKAQTPVENARTNITIFMKGKQQATTIYVAPSSSIPVSISMSLDNNSSWQSTQWAINTVTGMTGAVCRGAAEGHGSYATNGGPYVENFAITAPASNGTYNTHFRLNANGNCNVTASSSSVDYTGNVVVGHQTTTTLSQSSSASEYGDSVDFTATVTSASGTPNGVVDFYEGTTLLGSANLTSGQATLTLSNLTLGSHSIFASYRGVAGTPNYASSESGTVSHNVAVKPISLTVSAENKVYDGTADATVSVSLPEGSPNGLTVSYNTASFADAFAGNNKTVTIQGIQLSGNGASNYSVSSTATTTANIEQAPLTVTARNVSRPFNVPSPAQFLYDITGFVHQETLETSGVMGVPSCSTTREQTSSVGHYPITCMTGSLVSTNYRFTFVDGDFNVTQADQTIDFGPLAGKTYGDADFSVSATATSGLDVSFESLTTDVCSVTNSLVHLIKNGQCRIEASQGGNSNYGAAEPVVQSFQVAKKPITAVVVVNDKPYDGTTNAVISSADLSSSAVVGTDSISVDYSGATAAFDTKNAGDSKDVTVSGLLLTGADAGKYTLSSSATTTASISKAPLTVTANNKTRVYRAPNPSFDAAISGFVHDETLETSGVSGLPECSTTATVDSFVGAYPIACNVGDLASNNYAFTTFVSGQLSITKATPQILFVAPPTAVFDTVFSVNPTSDSSESPIILSASGGCSLVENNNLVLGFQVRMTSGTTACVLTASQAASDNYFVAENVVRTVDASKAPATLSFVTASLSQAYNSAPRTVLVDTDPSGLSGVSVTYNGSPDAPTNAGDYTVVATLTNDDYSASSITDTLHIVRASSTTTFTSTAPSSLQYGQTYSASATTTGDGVLTISASPSSVCTIDSPNVVRMVSGVGTCTVTATTAQGNNFEGSSAEPQTITASRAPSTTSFTSIAPSPLAFGGTYMPTATTTSDGTLTIDASGSCSFSSSTGLVTITSGSGTCTVTATATQSDNYEGSSAEPQVISATLASSTTTFTSIAPSTLAFGGTYMPIVTTTSDGTPTLSVSGSCSLLNGTVTITSGSGVCTVSATTDATSNYASSSASQTIDATRAESTTTFTSTAPTSLRFGETYTPTATTTGDGTITISASPSSVCTIDSSNVVRMVSGGGTCTIAATTAQGSNYEGSSATQTITAQMAAQTISFTNPGTKTYGNSDFQLFATGGDSGNPVTFVSDTPSVCAVVLPPATLSVGGSFVHIFSAGECSITASQEGNGDYEDATPNQQTFTINKADATIVVTGGTFTYDTNPHGATCVSATGVFGEDFCSLLDLGASFTTVPGGTASWSFAGNGNYNTASGSVSIVINRASQTITFPALSDRFYGSPDFDLLTLSPPESRPSVSSGLQLTFTASSNPSGLCTVNGSVVHIVNPGTCTITASQMGDGNYNEAASVSRSFQMITSNDAVDVSITDPALQYVTRATLPSTPNAPVTFTVPIVVSDVTNHGFVSFEFTVDYDSTKLTPTSPTTELPQNPVVVTSGDVAFPMSSSITSNVPQPGKLSVVGGDGSAIPLSGGGRLLSLQFTANEIGCTPITFGSPTHTFVFNTGGNPLSVATGTVCVAEDTTTTVSFGSGPFVYNGSPFTATATTTGNRTGIAQTPVSISYNSVSACTNVTTPNGCSATATYEGDQTHNASSASTSITIEKRPITVSAAASDKTYDGDRDADVVLTLSPLVLGGSASYTTALFDTPNVGTGKTVTVSGIQLVDVDLTNNYLANLNSEATATASITKAAQTINFATLSYKLIGSADFSVADSVTITAPTTGGSTNPVTFSTTTTSVCTVTPQGSVHLVFYGQCTITTSKLGDDNYLDAQDASQSFNVIPYETALNVSLPSSIAPTYHGETYTIPVSVAEMYSHAISSITFDMTYNPMVWTLDNSTPLTCVSIVGCSSVTTSTPSSGTLRVTIMTESGTYLSGSGTLVNLSFVASNRGGGDFTFSSFTFTSNTPSVHPVPAAFSNNPLSTTVINGDITGRVTSFYNGIALPGVTLSAAGSPPVSAVTNGTGDYTLTGFDDGSYTVTPSKPNEPRTTTAILGNDVTMIQRFRVGLCPFVGDVPDSNGQCPRPWSSVMAAAADVDRNGFVQSFDAALIQQFKAGIPNVVNQTGMWKFTASSRSYTNVWTPKTGEDYTALLLGDVDGSWMPPSSVSTLKNGKTTSIEKFDKSDETGYVKPQIADVTPLAVTVSLPTRTLSPGATVTQELSVGDLSGQNVASYDFDIVYNPAVVEPTLSLVDKSGTLSSNMSVIANVVAPGRLAVSASGINPLSGSGVLLKLVWRAVGNNGDTTALSFDPFIFNGGTPSAVVTNGGFQILAPTAANVTVSGKLVDAFGNPVARAMVELADSSGATRVVRSNSFGNFIFETVQAGQTYTVSVNTKSYRFTPQVVSVVSNVSDMVLIAEP